MDEDTFSKEVFLKVEPVLTAWKMASDDIDHPGWGTRLLRPGFCKSKPYAGRFNQLSLGKCYKHKLKEKILPPSGSEGNSMG